MIEELIRHPERMDRDTLYELRSMLALYPYYQTARLLMLQNLYLLHDPTFDEELRRAAIYITDRRTLFQMIEATHYSLKQCTMHNAQSTMHDAQRPADDAQSEHDKPSRTISLIDNFLESIPKSDDPKEQARRKPTPADAAVDYVAYLLETEGEDQPQYVPEMKGQDLIDSFINSDKSRITLSEQPEYMPQIDEEPENGENVAEEGYFTETLARIYIKQGRYAQALEIIQRLSLQFPKKNAYFADQIRFLQKLIINNNKKQ